MKFDDLASAWKEQNDRALSPEEREAVIARVCRRVERIGGTVFRRDLVETIAAVFVIIIFGRYLYVAPADHVVSKSGAAILVCWGLFIIYTMHRTRTIQKPASLDAPVREFCRIELGRLDRQIQLLRGVLWWYIGPCIVGVNVMFVGMAGFGAASLVYALVTLLLGWGLYALNMRAVANHLVPPRNELASLLAQLEDAAVPPMESPSSPRRPFSVMFLLVMLVALGLATAVVIRQADDEYPKRAPFTGVRWEGSKPVVKVDDAWFSLVSLDGIAAEDIVTFTRWTYMDRGRKRFEEDLVEVLTRMGHEPRDTVRLVVSPPGSRATRTLEDVPMTEANRRAIYKAARARERGGQESATRTAAPVDDADTAAHLRPERH